MTPKPKGAYQGVVYRKPKPLPGKQKGVTRRAARNIWGNDKRAVTREVRRLTRAVGAGARGDVYAEQLDGKLVHQCHAVVKHGRMTLTTDEL